MYRFTAPSKHFQSTEEEVDTASLFSKVLLIEDEPAHATLIKRALKGVVGELQHAQSAKEGLDAVTSDLCELVFCDLHLPDMSGMKVISEIRAARPSLPIIVLTSSSDLGDAVEAMREGAWDFMLKQFTEDLAGQIRIVVGRTAERKLQQLRELEVRAERDAFWVAAYTAQDGLAVLGDGGQVGFANKAFGNVFTLLGSSIEEHEGPINLVELIKKADPEVAQDLASELRTVSADTLWSSELEFKTENPDGSKGARFFELTLSGASPAAIKSASVLTRIVPQHRYRVLWIRETTRRKDRERFQRDLLSTTTHDLKGPLNAILTSAELLGDENFEVEERRGEMLTRIASCARNAVSIIDELLSARRIQDGVLVVKPRWYSVAEIVEDAVLDYLPIANSKEIEFYSRPTEEGMEIYADRMSLNRVIGNLVSNALKFTPRGGKVEIWASRVGSAVRLAVSDTGAGISADARHKLFERFSRLEEHAEIEGTGLGLFVSKNIMDAHGGRIEVRSAVGSGTTFFVTFPDGLRVQPEKS